MSDEALLLEQITATIGRIQAKTDDLQQSITGKLGWLPGGLRDGVVAGWNRFSALMADIWHALADILGHLGSPDALYTAARTWSSSVGGPVSETVGQVDASVLTVDDTWNGTAADAYRQLLPAQKAALTAVKTVFTDAIATALSGLAKGIYVFWGALAAAIVGLATGIVAGLASASTILGLPATPVIIVSAGLVAAAAIAAGEWNLGSTAADLNTTLQEKLAESTAFPGGHWPSAGLAG
jgi:uncharacterized protein YukE